MEIVESAPPAATIHFDQLHVGNAFNVPHDGRLYLKVDYTGAYNAVNLASGYTYTIKQKDGVIPRVAKVVVS